MGKEKVKVYQYNKDGKFIKEWDSQTELRSKYYSKNKGKYPIFRKDFRPKDLVEFNISILPDETLVSDEKIGRIGILKFIKRYENSYINRQARSGKYSDNRINIYDLDNNKIAEFKDIDICSKLTGQTYNKVYNKLCRGVHGHDGLRYEAIK